MSDYQLEGPKPTRMSEVILPKKLGYFGKVQEVLEDLFDEQAIRAIPFVKKSIARRKLQPKFDEEAWIKSLCRASRGYSIYEMDGRYLSASGPIDARVLVIRFIFHNPAEGSTRRRTSWRPRWKWSITWSLTASPMSFAWRKKSGFLSITGRNCPSGESKLTPTSRDVHRRTGWIRDKEPRRVTRLFAGTPGTARRRASMRQARIGMRLPTAGGRVQRLPPENQTARLGLEKRARTKIVTVIELWIPTATTCPLWRPG